MYIDNELCPACGNEIAYGTACPCLKSRPYTAGCENYHAPDDGFCMWCDEDGDT